jgi:uncharacterized protein (TIGR02246 family)
MRRLAFFAGFLAILSCQAPHPPPAEDALVPETAPMSDEDQIRARIEEYELAYNNGEVEALGAMFVEDGDMIDPTGAMTHGRAALEERWQKMFAGPVKGTTNIDATSIRLIRPEIAIVDGTSQSFGMKAPDGTEIRNVPGMYSSVWVKRNGQWLLHCLRPMIPVT